MKPGEYIIINESLEINLKNNHINLTVVNEGDRPIQVGSHYHFAETNSYLKFDRKRSYGKRLNIPAGTSIRFEPGQTKNIELVDILGKKKIIGFNQY